MGKVTTRRLKWKSPKGVHPRVRLTINLKKQKMNFKASRLDFVGIPQNPIEVRVVAGDDSGSHMSNWTTPRPGRFKVPKK